MNRKNNKDDRRISAYHEAGHVVLQTLLIPEQPIERVLLYSKKGEERHGGTKLGPTERRHMNSADAKNYICVCYGGRAAEMIFFSYPYNGAQDDLFRASTMARWMVTHLGFTDILPNIALDPDMICSERLQMRIEREMQGILRKEYNRAELLLRSQDSMVRRIAEKLLKHGELHGRRLEKLRSMVRDLDAENDR